MGPPSKVPTILVVLLATHAEVAQVSQGELSGKDVWRLIEASVHGTAFEDQFKTTTVWRKVLLEYPNSLQAANKISVEDARSQWTTHDNLDKWFDDAKLDLLKSGLVRDILVLDGHGKVESELDFRGEDVKRRIINMDETHHDLSITGDKAGTRALKYHNPSLQRGPHCQVKSSRHVTGVYATNAAGEALPPICSKGGGNRTEERRGKNEAA
jgi:hypothetical protein